jgi:predicted ATPase/DNA-binding SARP family transcriptional activator
VVEIRVLGPIRGLVGGEPVDIGGPTQRRLLASLVARPDEVVPITSLLEHLWGDDSPPSGPASIQSYVSRLRRALGPAIIETVAPGYRLGLDGLTIDSSLFVEIASTLPDEPGPRIEAIETALRLWAGPPFEDFDHVDFAARRLYEVRYDLEEERARLLAGLGRNSEAVAAMERITAAEPLRESAWATLGIVLAGMGRQADAVRALDRYRSKLADIGLEPGPAFDAAESEVFETRPLAPAPRAPMIRAGTSFVGRADEVAELRRLLEESRLVSVVGSGGMGKTRVAIEVVSDWTSTPVAFVRLESLRDDREVAPTVLNAIGGETRGDPVESIVAQLSRGQPRLIVLDNVEHVIEATAVLVSELVMSTDTKVLVTTREPLNTPGERILGLGPMDPESAIELFRVRARGLDPDFEASAATLDMLCEELDYMPLAIEMAAARTKALAAEDILTRLSRRFGLLDRPLRGSAERHRSLDALVDWSYSLLDPPGQRVFERLSVVAGTFDVDLATAVAGFGDVPADQVAGLLANLVERSLVARTSSGAFRMLRVLKSYAEQRLAGSGDEPEARRIHSKWFADLAADIGDGLSTPEETEWIARANDAVEDLALALAWATDTGDLDTAQAILEGLFDWFYHRQPPAIIGFGDMVLADAHGHDAHAVACAWAALAALKRGEIESAEELAATGTLVEGAPSRFAWFMTGEIASHLQRLPEALDAYRKQRIRASNLHDPIGVIDSTAGEALALAYQGEYPQAVEVAADLGRMAAEVGAPTYRAYADYAMAVSVVDTDFQRARELFEEATRQAESVNNQFIVALAKSALGSVLSRRDPGTEATQLLHDAMDIWENMGLPAYQWAIVQYLAGIIAEGGDLETAGLLIAAANHAGRLGLGPGQRHWAEVTQLMESDQRWGQWSLAAVSLDLAAAVEVALAATQPRR